MPLVVKDRVRETSTTTGTGTITLNGAVSNFQSFTAIGDGNTTFYTITLDSAGEWEVGIGTYTASGTTLSRDIVLESSNSGSLVPFSAGTKTVFCTYPAEKSVYYDASDNVGIGTSSPAAKLDVRGSSTFLVNATNPTAWVSVDSALTTGSMYNQWNTTSNVGISGTYTNHAYTFVTNNTERMRISSDGRLQINGSNSLATTLVSTSNTFPLNNAASAYQYRANCTLGTANTGAVGFGSTYSLPATGTFGSSYQFYADTLATDGATLTNNYGVFVATQTVGTNIYGVYSNIASGTNRYNFYANGTADNYFAGNVGIGTVNDGTAVLQIGAGTATVAPLEFISGTLMTTPDGGSMEFDSNNLSFTNDATGLRGYVPATNLFRLTANGAAIGPAIANFFGANSAISVIANGKYELEAYCYFTKTTAGTVTVTLTSSQTPVNINGTVDYGAIAGGTATGAANRISLFASASTAAAFGASGSLTTAVNHAFIIRAIIETNATTAGNIRINFTSSAGTVTPLRNSYYKLTKLPLGNSGNFVA